MICKKSTYRFIPSYLSFFIRPKVINLQNDIFCYIWEINNTYKNRIYPKYYDEIVL